MSFGISHREVDPSTVLVALEGELALGSAPTFKRALLELRTAGYSRFVLDFSRVTFFDSTALGVLVVFNRGLAVGGQLALADLPPLVTKVLDVTGINRVLNLFPTVQAAIQGLGEAPGALPAHYEGRSGSSPEPEDLRSNGREAESSATPAHGVQAPLTEDAAVVLGIAATAIPFAPSLDDQAERWLRALSRSGDTGIALKVLGAHEAPSQPGAENQELHPAGEDVPSADVVATVARRASELADQHRHRAIQTEDLLGAVATVYGSVFDRVLERHGVGRNELLDALRSSASNH
jgi:anti-sigma B factor antagonist